MKRIVYIIGCIVLLMACSEPQEYRTLLERAQAVMDDRPDSALAILDSLGQHQADFGKHFRMQYQLHRMNALNKVDTLFHTTSEAKTLADYFNGHGSPNEQMLAYYLLGRAYFDIHEAPMSLSCYQTASEKADTTAPDCNYRQLSRVYGQMSLLFYEQNLIRQSLDCSNIAIRYAWIGKDTLNVIRSTIGKIGSYKFLQKTDSAIFSCEYASKLSRQYGDREMAAAVFGGIISVLVEKNQLEKAKTYIDYYERESGYFDSIHDIARGREIYYYIKGTYYLAANIIDSAEFYFRKELQYGKDFNNQNAGSRGLALLFQKKNQPDSAAKYALYSYRMNDSVYKQMATDEVEHIQGIYNYSRNQEIAQQEKERAESERNKVRIISFLLFLFVVTVSIIAREVYVKQRERKRKYEENISLLATTQADVVKLRSYGEKLNQMLDSKEKESEYLISEIESYKSKVGLQKDSAEDLLQKSPIYRDIQKTAAKALLLTDDIWHLVYRMTIDILPNFYKLISSKKLELNDNEFKACILIRLHFAPKDIANMLGVTQPYITKVCKNLMQKLFNEEGKSRDLVEKLKMYS